MLVLQVIMSIRRLLAYVQHTGFARMYSLRAQCVNDALCVGAVAGVDAVQASGAQWKLPQEVFWQGRNVASFNPAAIEEFIKALHGKS